MFFWILNQDWASASILHSKKFFFLSKNSFRRQKKIIWCVCGCMWLRRYSVCGFFLRLRPLPPHIHTGECVNPCKNGKDIKAQLRAQLQTQTTFSSRSISFVPPYQIGFFSFPTFPDDGSKFRIKIPYVLLGIFIQPRGGMTTQIAFVNR